MLSILFLCLGLFLIFQGHFILALLSLSLAISVPTTITIILATLFILGVASIGVLG